MYVAAYVDGGRQDNDVGLVLEDDLDGREDPANERRVQLFGHVGEFWGLGKQGHEGLPVSQRGLLTHGERVFHEF